MLFLARGLGVGDVEGEAEGRKEFYSLSRPGTII